MHFFRQPFSKKLYIQSRLVFLSHFVIHARSTRYANLDIIINLLYARRGINCGLQEKHAILISRLLLRMRRMYVASIILDPSAYGFGNARVSSRKLCAGVAKIWLFGPHSACSLIQPKLFPLFYIYFIAKVLCCFGIRTEEIQLTALKNFQVSKALVVAAEKIPLNVPNHRFETWSLHILDSWLNISVYHFKRR